MIFESEIFLDRVKDIVVLRKELENPREKLNKYVVKDINI
jgi:hypothetical protein